MTMDNPFERQYGDSEFDVIVRFLMMILPALFGIIIMAVPFMWAGTYVQVFEDHIEGKGVCGIINKFTKELFSFTYQQITSITVSKNIININVNGKIYMIISNADTALKVFMYCSKQK